MKIVKEMKFMKEPPIDLTTRLRRARLGEDGREQERQTPTRLLFPAVLAQSPEPPQAASQIEGRFSYFMSFIAFMPFMPSATVNHPNVPP
jgi:hypothetical protein